MKKIILSALLLTGLTGVATAQTIKPVLFVTL